MVGVLSRPAGPAGRKFPAVLFLHGFPGSEKNVDIQRALLKLGVATFSPHFAGTWGSDGLYSFSGLTSQAAAALRYLSSRDFVDQKRLAVFGFSMGGWTALNLAAKARTLKAVAAVSPVRGPEMIDENIRGNIAHLGLCVRKRSIDALVKDFIATMRREDVTQAVASLSCPLLLVHGNADEVVPFPGSRLIIEAAPSPKTFVIAQGARHDFLDRREWLTRLVARWLIRRLGATRK